VRERERERERRERERERDHTWNRRARERGRILAIELQEKSGSSVKSHSTAYLVEEKRRSKEKGPEG
jgi:hypothetical protein